MTPARRWTLVVALEALLIVLMLPFGFVFTGSLRIHQFQVVLLGIVGAVGWAAMLRRPSSLPWPIALAPLPLLVTMGIASLVSAYPTLSWMATWEVAAYTGVFWLLAKQASHRVGRRNLVVAIGMVVILVLLSFAIAVATSWRSWVGLGFPITSLPLRPGNTGGLALIPTWFADLVALAAPMLVAALWRRGVRRVAVALAVITLVAIVLTGTRSVLLIIAGLVVVTLVLSIGSRRGGRTIAVAAVASLAIASAGIAVLLASGRSFDEGRFSAYASAVDRFRESPLFGGGPGTYGVRRMSDMVDILGHLAFPDAHNIVMTTAAETGLFGLLGLLGTAMLIGVATRRAWQILPADRPVISAAIFGVLVFVGHGMVDVVFGLIGTIILAMAVVAVAVAYAGGTEPRSEGSKRFVLASMTAALAVFVLSTVLVLRTEGTFAALDEADRNLESSPAAGLATARRATETSPDSVPAWWVQMVAADASGDTGAAVNAARKTIDLEGFGQEWMSLAIMSSRLGDRATELEAITHASSGPVDPFVELNAAILLGADGDANGAEVAARRLVEVQPDIEQVLATGPQSLEAMVAMARPEVARTLLASGDPDSAFLIALTGEDRPLADELVATLGTSDPSASRSLSSVVAAWFGDASAAAATDASSVAAPTLSHLTWSWRVAAHACDTAATERWEEAAWIGFGYRPTTPVELGVAPEFQSRLLPTYYPSFIWRLEHPLHPYVAGSWTFSLGRPACVAG
jgi:O-antigen ligase